MIEDTRDEETDEPGAESRLAAILESMLFAAGAPVPLRKLVEVLNGPSVREVKAALAALAAVYEGRARGVRLVTVAGGYQFRTAPENAEWVRALLRERPPRLGRAMLETLAIVAYKQPVTRAEIEGIRGVDADSSLSALLARRLIRIAGRKEAVGRPLLYATTPEFLEVFGLKDLGELPALKEIGPVAETDDETCAEDGEPGRAVAEDLEPGGDQLAAASRGVDSLGSAASERSGGEDAGDEGGSPAGSDHR